MLLITGETTRSDQALNGVVREMSFTLSIFASTATFGELLTGHSRRIILMTEAIVSKENLSFLKAAKDHVPFAIIVAADRASLRTSQQAELVDKLASFDNVGWVGENFDFDRLSSSARRCRRHVLTVSRQEVKDALDQGQFILRYQLKVERNSGTEWLTHEAEALVR